MKLDKIFGIDIGKLINQTNMKSRFIQATVEYKTVKS